MKIRTVNKCPVCDSTQIQIIDCVREIKVPFAEPVKQKQTICQCGDFNCGADIRLWSESSKVIKRRIYASAKRSIPKLLKEVNNKGYVDSRIERALYLEEGVIKKWKLGKGITPEIVALVRYIYMNPDSIRFAEEGFVKEIGDNNGK